MQKKRLELSRYRYHTDLNRARLPIPPLLRMREMGLEPICYRAAVESVNRRANGRRGYYGTSPNKQYDYDHRYDSALYMGNAFKERKLAVLRSAYETYRKEAAWCAGPALVETFGEEGFAPENKKAALALNAHQEALTLLMPMNPADCKSIYAGRRDQLYHHCLSQTRDWAGFRGCFQGNHPDQYTGL